MNMRFSSPRRSGAVIVAAIATLASSGAAFAQTHSPAAQQLFKLPDCRQEGDVVSVRLRTGVNQGGVSLALTNPGNLDPHWTVTIPGGSAMPAYATSTSGLPWRMPTAPTQWIQPSSLGSPEFGRVGIHTYQAQLVTPADPYLYTSFQISGIVAADNTIDSIKLDNQAFSPPNCPIGSTFQCMLGKSEQLTTIAPGKINPSSPHVLEIKVYNQETYIGLYVDLLVTAKCSRCTTPRPPFQQSSSLQRSPSRQSLLRSRPTAPAC